MEQNYIIMTDSSTDLDQHLVDELGLVVLPLTVAMEGKEYKNYPDERDITAKYLYTRLRAGAIATTAAINVDTFIQEIGKYLAQGKDVLYLGFSSGLSATYNSSCIAAEELRAAYPDRKVITVDTLAASTGEGLLCYLVSRRRSEGATIEEAAQYAEETKLHIAHWFTVDDLHFLKRGGRVSAATAILGSALGIKPLLHTDNEGHLTAVDKVRGRKRVIAAMVERMAASAVEPEKQTIFISHGDCVEDAQYLADLVRERLNPKEIILQIIGPVIGAHSGPGTLALFFQATER